MRSTLRVAGEVCLTAGVLVGLFAAYLMGEPARGRRRRRIGSRRSSTRLGGQVLARRPVLPRVSRRRYRTGSSWLPAGRSPSCASRRSGAQWRFTIIQGTQLAQLNVSPGHVPGTQLPGQLGNFAVAGHRVTAGNPFWSLPRLKAGDMVYVDTRYDTYAYRVLARPAWVAPTDLAVLNRSLAIPEWLRPAA